MECGDGSCCDGGGDLYGCDTGAAFLVATDRAPGCFAMTLASFPGDDACEANSEPGSEFVPTQTADAEISLPRPVTTCLKPGSYSNEESKASRL